jgi:hypothetical protein
MGATVVAAKAGDMISYITFAMAHNLGLGKIATPLPLLKASEDRMRKGDELPTQKFRAVDERLKVLYAHLRLPMS